MALFNSFTFINCFSMISVIPIYSCMKKRDLKNFTIASSAAISICVFTYTGNVILQEWSLEANYDLLSCVLHTAELPMKKLCNTGMIQYQFRFRNSFAQCMYNGKQGHSLCLVLKVYIIIDSFFLSFVNSCFPC